MTKLLGQYNFKNLDVLIGRSWHALQVPLFVVTNQSITTITALVHVKGFCILNLLSLLLGRMAFIHIVGGSLMKEREIHI